MNIKKFLSENTAAGVSEGGNYAEIMVTPFTNQDRKDIENLGILRYIANGENQKLYVFNSDLLHARAAKELKFQYNFSENETNVKPIIYGICHYDRATGKLVDEGSFNLEVAFGKAKDTLTWRKIFKQLINANWDFAEKEITGIKKDIASKKRFINNLEKKQ